MGLIRTVVDLTLISGACAGVRRATGYSVQSAVMRYVSNEQAQKWLGRYFGVGEFVADKVDMGLRVLSARSPRNRDDRDDDDRRGGGRYVSNDRDERSGRGGGYKYRD